MAKLVSMLGKPAITKACGSNAFIVCGFLDRLPIDADTFLWSEDKGRGVFNVVDLHAKRLLADEEVSFAFEVIPANLGLFAAGFALEAWRQLAGFGLAEFSYGPSGLDLYRIRVPGDEFNTMTLTLAARSDAFVVFGNKALNAAALVGAIVVVLLLSCVRRAGSAPEIKALGEPPHMSCSPG